MKKIEKRKAIDIVLKIERVLDMWRKSRKVIVLLIVLLVLAFAFLGGRENNASGVGSGNSVDQILSGENADLNSSVKAEAVAETSKLAQIFAKLGGSGALSAFRPDDEGQRTSVVLKVPAEFDTIQKAINSALPGDVVSVAAGEYKENITMRNGVSLVGEHAETTILNGDEKGSVVVFKNLENKETRLENFSIKNAQENLSGILIENSSPIINRNIIFSNDYDIYIKGHSSPTVQRNVLEQSKAGVQIFNLDKVTDSNPLIVDNLIYANKKGINIYNSQAVIEHNTISFNSAYGIEAGATFGIYLTNSSATIGNNLITDNGACEICSGVYVDDKSEGVKLSFNDIWNNQNNFICFGQCEMEDNNRSEDPFYENGLLFSFNLMAESPFLTAGSDGQRLGARL
ncbi:MAG: right-handed parallel beta-helix repeat-containing protein [Candidatus Paceibacterota bacterium]|jgi:parallel beta-helix repeat protein